MIKKTNTTDEYLRFIEEIKQDIQPPGMEEKIENIDEYKEFELIVNTYRLYKKQAD